MPPFGCYYNFYSPYCNSYMDYGYHRPMMYRPYDGWKYAMGNIFGSLLGECFANYFGPVSTALSDAALYRGLKTAGNIYNYCGLA